MNTIKYSLLVGAICCAVPLAAQSPAESYSPSNVWGAEELSASTVGAAQMHSFQRRAEQKLQDFADLLTLVANPKALDLRQEAQQSAQALFVDKAVYVHWHGASPKTGGKMQLEALLAQIGETGRAATFQVAGFSSRPPDGCRQRSCSWEMQFCLTEKSASGRTLHYRTTVTVWLKRVKKQFGHAEKESWEVLLGEIGPLKPVEKASKCSE